MSTKQAFPEWVDRQVAAWLVGMSASAFDKSLRARISPEHMRQDGRVARFNAPGVVAAYVAWRASKLAAVADGDESGDTAELIKVKTQLAKTELAKRRGELIPVEHVEEVANAFADLARTTTDRLQREFGAKAAEMWNEGVEDATRRVLEFVKRSHAKIAELRDEDEPDSVS